MRRWAAAVTLNLAGLALFLGGTLLWVAAIFDEEYSDECVRFAERRVSGVR